MSEKYLLFLQRVSYLSEIAENNRAYDNGLNQQVSIANKLYAFEQSLKRDNSEKHNNTLSST